MSLDDPYASFSDANVVSSASTTPVSDSAPAAVASTTTDQPTGVIPPSEIAAHIHAILSSDAPPEAKKSAITEYVKSYHGDLTKLSFPDNLSGATGVHVGDPAKVAQTAPTDPNDPYSSFQDAPSSEVSQDAQPMGLYEAALTGVKRFGQDVASGVGSLLDTVASPIKLAASAAGLDIPAYANSLPEQLGLGTPQNGIDDAIVKGATGGALTAGAGGLIAGAPGLAGTIGTALAASPIADTVSSGAAAGGGEAAKQAGYGAAGQIAASLAAGGAGALLTGRAVNAVPATAPTDGQRAAQAAERLSAGPFTGPEGITPLAADTGGMVARKLTAGTAQTPFGAGPIAERAQQFASEGRGVRDAVASSIGTVLNPVAAGEAGIRGARSFIARTSQTGNQLYQKAQAAANGVRIQPKEALSALDRNITELSETPGGTANLGRLQQLRDDLGKGDFTVQGIRNMRTALRDDFAESGLRGSDIERRVNQVTDAANQDVIDGLHAAGRPEAAQAYRVADRYWRSRLSTIDNTLAPIIGKDGDKSGEQVVKALQSAMAGNNSRFAAFVRALPEQERNDVRASLISRLGRASAGNQTDLDNVFSLPTFLSNWSDGNLGERAKSALFGPESRAALNDLAAVANGAKQSIKHANHSNTAGSLETGRLLTYITALPTLGATVAGQLGIGHLLASPRFARWLARAPRTTLSTTAYAERLSRIAAAEPAISVTLMDLQKRLLQGANDSASSLAAQKPDNESSGVDR